MTAKPSIVFLGSGPVAAESVRQITDDFTIEAIITKQTTEGLLRAVAPAETPVLVANTRKELDDLISAQSFTSTVGVVIDYGVIISATTIASFPHGIINSHFSLLPLLRGADPISFAILEGLEETGVSLILINEGLDEGDLLAQSTYPLPSDITTPELTTNLIELSSAMLREILPLYLQGGVQPADQLSKSIATSKIPTYTRKLSKQDGVIDPNKAALQLEREVRAFADWPKSRLQIREKDVVITASIVSKRQIGKMGELKRDKSQLFLQTSQDCLEILRLKPAGKKEMTAAAFLAGYGHLIDAP